MTIADACILVSCLLPVLCAGAAKSPGFGKPQPMRPVLVSMRSANVEWIK